MFAIIIINLSSLFHRKKYPSPPTTHLILIRKNMSYKWQVRIKKTLIRGQIWNIGYHLHPQLEFPKQVVSKPEPHLSQIWKPGSRRESVKWSPITFQLLRGPEVSWAYWDRPHHLVKPGPKLERRDLWMRFLCQSCRG